MKRKTFDNYDYEEAFPVELDRGIQKKARKNFEKEYPLQVPDYEEQWKEQQEKLKEWELERLLKEGKVESLYRTTTTKAKNLQMTTKSGVRIDVESFVNNKNDYEILCDF